MCGKKFFFKNFIFYTIHLQQLTILTLLTYNTNNAYYTNHIYNVQNQNVYTTTTKTIHIHTKRKKKRKETTTTATQHIWQREDKNQSGMSYSFRPSTL